MAVSDVSICNLALQLLGAERITSLGQDKTEAKECNACYTAVRDREIRKYKWNFAKTRVVLAPDVDTPAFDYNYQFTKPSDCLRILPPNERTLDWQFEGNKIVTNEGDTLNLVYLRRVEDPAEFDDAFVAVLAAALAVQLVEKLTQSNSKKAEAAQAYKDALAAARRVNAFESTADEPPVDEWVAAREVGAWNGGR